MLRLFSSCRALFLSHPGIILAAICAILCMAFSCNTIFIMRLTTWDNIHFHNVYFSSFFVNPLKHPMTSIYHLFTNCFFCLSFRFCLVFTHSFPHSFPHSFLGPLHFFEIFHTSNTSFPPFFFICVLSGVVCAVSKNNLVNVNPPHLKPTKGIEVSLGFPLPGGFKVSPVFRCWHRNGGVTYTFPGRRVRGEKGGGRNRGPEGTELFIRSWQGYGWEKKARAPNAHAPPDTAPHQESYYAPTFSPRLNHVILPVPPEFGR